MAPDVLSEFVEPTATKLGIPGVAVGVWADGRKSYACHGVTSVDNPLPVDPDTLFLLGSLVGPGACGAQGRHAMSTLVLMLLNSVAWAGSSSPSATSAGEIKQIT